MYKTKYAFFDVDETLISVKSMFDFLEFWYGLSSGASFIGNVKYKLFMEKIKALSNKVNRSVINALYYQQFVNVHVEDLIEAGKLWWQEKLSRQDFFNHKIINLLKQHKKEGYEIVLVSGSMRYCLQPLSQWLGINVILCSEQEVEGGRLTGALEGKPVIGKEKAEKIKAFLANEKIEPDLHNSFAYGDHESDIHFLNLVGNPFFVKSSKRLEQANAMFNCPIIFI